MRYFVFGDSGFIGYHLVFCIKNFFYPSISIENIEETIKNIIDLKRSFIRINNALLVYFASIVVFLEGKEFEIHPVRIKNLITSSNILGKRFALFDSCSKYSFEEAGDWLDIMIVTINVCNNKLYIVRATSNLH